MEDIAGLGKIIDSKVAEHAYEDVISPAAKQVGYFAEDTLKAFRLFTSPIQLLAVAQDRLGRWLEEVRNSVPEERQVEASPEVAGPVLLNLRFVSEESVLKTLYLNLLRRAIDRDHQHEAHPGFVKIIEQISPDDAYFLFCLRLVEPLDEKISEHIKDAVPYIVTSKVPGMNNWCPERIQASLDLFRGLSVVNYEHANTLGLDGPIYQTVEMEFTQYGHNFAKTCLPTAWDGWPAAFEIER